MTDSFSNQAFNWQANGTSPPDRFQGFPVASLLEPDKLGATPLWVRDSRYGLRDKFWLSTALRSGCHIQNRDKAEHHPQLLIPSIIMGSGQRVSAHEQERTGSLVAAELQPVSTRAGADCAVDAHCGGLRPSILRVRSKLNEDEQY